MTVSLNRYIHPLNVSSFAVSFAIIHMNICLNRTVSCVTYSTLQYHIVVGRGELLVRRLISSSCPNWSLSWLFLVRNLTGSTTLNVIHDLFDALTVHLIISTLLLLEASAAFPSVLTTANYVFHKHFKLYFSQIFFVAWNGFDMLHNQCVVLYGICIVTIELKISQL